LSTKHRLGEHPQAFFVRISSLGPVADPIRLSAFYPKKSECFSNRLTEGIAGALLYTEPHVFGVSAPMHLTRGEKNYDYDGI
jgi:hypothetical protein